MSEHSLRAKFPLLETSQFRVTSPATADYTCIGYAAGDVERIWLPDPWPDSVFYWPMGVPRQHTVEAWTQVFESLGYRECETRDFEPGYEKVAIYADARGAPQHVARQLTTERWTSKIGKMEDIEHELDGLEGESYGSVVLILCRDVVDAGG